VTPIVSVMMPAYNASAFIGSAIESLLAQTLSDWELIIVDDGSTDATAETAQRYEDPRITLITQPNAGESAARNCALMAMSGRYVAFLDADDLYHPKHLERTVGYLEMSREADGVYTDGDHCNESGQLLPSLSSRRRGPFEGNLFEQLAWGSDVFGPPLCVVLRREPIIRRGLRWDPAIVIGPDWDFFVHFARQATFGYIAERTCIYRVHASNVTVRTGSERRRASLALCREKALELPEFAACSLKTRSWVFYELLVELLDGQPEGQAKILAHPQFQALPEDEQARLLRLMAVKALGSDTSSNRAGEWLAAARRLNKADRRTLVLSTLFRMSPDACRQLVRARPATSTWSAERHPLADLLASSTQERRQT